MDRGLGRVASMVAASGVVVAGLLGATAPVGAQAQNCAWNVVSSSTGGGGTLNGVAAVAASDVWAVGAKDSGGGGAVTLTQHWNGSTWTVVSSPSFGVNDSLNSVTVVSANDVWAVGGSIAANSSEQTLIEHWDGTSWTRTTSPNPGGQGNINILDGVSAVSTNDVWAVGQTGTQSGDHTLIEHWDGTSWTQVTSANPDPNGLNSLQGVSAASTGDVWAVGGTSAGGSNRPLIEHWDGSNWSVSTSPTVSQGGLNAVRALSAGDVWAVGGAGASNGRTLTEHWNGSNWTVVASPSPGTGHDELLGVSGVSGNDVWAVGNTGQNGSSDSHTLIEHWDGTGWTQAASPSPGAKFNPLNATTAVSGSDVWAVGDMGTDTLIEHYTCVAAAAAAPSTSPTPTVKPALPRAGSRSTPGSGAPVVPATVIALALFGAGLGLRAKLAQRP